jgi:3-isopropylmalate dehydrogenase
MDDLQGLVTLLVRELEARQASRVDRPIPLAEIETLVSYRLARRVLGIASHEDFEMAILRLAAGVGGYASAQPPEAAAQLAAEAASPNPETSLFRAFPEATLQLAPAALASLGDETRFAPPSEGGREGQGTPMPSSSAQPTSQPERRPGVEAEGALCPSCGDPMALSWKFCPTCGESRERPARQHRIAVIPGDGIGPEVIAAAIPVLDAAAACYGFTCSWDELPLSASHYLETGTALPEPVFERLRDDSDAVLLGALGDPRVPDNEHARAILLGLRFRLDLYINFRPVRLLHPDLTPLQTDQRTGAAPDIDLVVFRENTEGVYLGRGRVDGDEHIAEEVNTGRGVERILRAAFEWADANGQTRVTMADKSNAIPTHRLWLDRFRAIATDFPGIEAEHRYVDALAMEMVRDPSRFQVIVTSNLFGDILSDLAAGLVGGLGLAASANLHPGRTGLFEPVHGSAPPLAGQGVANPIAAVLTGALMFAALGEAEAARALEDAVRRALESGIRTRDIGGDDTTEGAAQAVLEALA